MPLGKQSYPIGLGLGLDTKTDPKQVMPGKMLRLVNIVLTKAREYMKRNGSMPLGSAPTSTATSLLTTATELLLVGLTTLYSYLGATRTWLSKGTIVPLSYSVYPVYRATTEQTIPDSAIHSNGMQITAWLDSSGSCQYSVFDTTTKQQVLGPVNLASGAALPRCAVLGSYLIVGYLWNDGGTWRMMYIAVSAMNPTSPYAAVSLSSQADTTTHSWDLVENNNVLYFVWNASDGGGAIRVTAIDSTLAQRNTVAIAGGPATAIAAWADTVTNYVWVGYASTAAGGTVSYFIVDGNLNTILAPTTVATSTGTVINLTGAGSNGTSQLYWEVSHTYSFSSARSDYVQQRTLTQSGPTGSVTVFARGVGIVTKAFRLNNDTYLGLAYAGGLEPTYFVYNSEGQVVLRLAPSNGGGYRTQGPTVATVSQPSAGLVSFAYQTKDLLTTTSGKAYTQLGVNQATLDFTAAVDGLDFGSNLNIGAGILLAYDGVSPVEQNFLLYPEDLGITSAGSGSGLAAGTYFYVGVYEWFDAKGNRHQSGASIPYPTPAGLVLGGTSTVTINFPTLRTTLKVAPRTPISLVLYRWSQAQQIYYRVTSLTSPVLNDTTVDSVAITDSQTDAQISGNEILYTTGGVVDNGAANSSSISTEWDERLWVLDPEDRNRYSFSKQVSEGVPVEFSPAFSYYVNPVFSRAGDTGPITSTAAMDDKLISFKANAICYTTGAGPDNTGASFGYSEPILLTSTVGCANQRSIAVTTNGIIFQSNKGFWLLGRDLSTSYIGADVEAYNSDTCTGAKAVPGTNEIRFTMASGVVLVYDYFYQQWYTFTNQHGVGCVIFQNLFTYARPSGLVLQETPGAYTDNGTPVLQGFQLGWLNVGGLQGFIRAYRLYTLGQYLSPHNLQVTAAYDFASGPTQTTTINPINVTSVYGDDPFYGAETVYGNDPQLGNEQWRINFTRQKCQAVQLTVQELLDPSNPVAGPGFTISGLALVAGVKSTYPRLPAKQSAS